MTIESSNSDVKITAEAGNLGLAGATVRVGRQTQAKDIELETAAGNIDIRDSTLQANGDIEANLEDHGVLSVNNSLAGDGGTRIEERTSTAARLLVDGGSVDGTPET